MASVITGDITSIKNGIIVHQVNCQNKIGRGLSGQIIRLYPLVRQAYHNAFSRKTDPFGHIQYVHITRDLIVANLFSQRDCGNPKRTGKIYTDIDALVEGLTTICTGYPNEKIYIPYNIGCGLGGESWDRVYDRIKDLNLIIVKLPDRQD